MDRVCFFFSFFSSEASCMNSALHDDTGIGWSVSVYSFLVVCWLWTYMMKKRLKISKEQSESVNRRWTDNSMAKRKMSNNDLQKQTTDLAKRAPLSTRGELICHRREGSFYSKRDVHTKLDIYIYIKDALYISFVFYDS